MNPYSIALLIYGDPLSDKSAFTEDKYKALAYAFRENGYMVDSVIYNDSIADKLAIELLPYDAILVWVNPVEQGNNRDVLDGLLNELSMHGCFISAHPETILKMGTKEILFTTKDLEFGTDTRVYRTYEEFKEQLGRSFPPAQTRVLKQYRGNGGNGVFKIEATVPGDRVILTHAKGMQERTLTQEELMQEMQVYFSNRGALIDQPWNSHIVNGMVRCYSSGIQVAGFGYQEVNALYPATKAGQAPPLPGKRFYFSEDCGLFRDLRIIMESAWIPQLQKVTGVPT